MDRTHFATSLFSLFRVFKHNMLEELQLLDLQIPFLHLVILKEIQLGEPATAQQLTKTMGLDKAQVSRTLKELHTNGFVEKLPNPVDKRMHWLSLTPDGLKQVALFEQAETRVAERMIQGLKPEDAQQWIDLVEQITNNLKLPES